MLAARLAAHPQRRQRAQRRGDAALKRSEVPIDLDRRPVGKQLARQAVGQQVTLARGMQHVDLLGPPVRLGAVGAERQHRDVDQVGMAARDGVGVEPQQGALGDRGVVDENIRLGQQRAQGGAPLGAIEIGDPAAEAGRQIGEQRGDPVLQERRLAAQRRALRRLDQHHLGAHRPEQPRGVGRRHARSMGDDAQAGEWWGGFGHASGSFKILPHRGWGTSRRLVEGALQAPPSLGNRAPSVSRSGCHLPRWGRIGGGCRYLTAPPAVRDRGSNRRRTP